jgi:hypothetical protein
MRLRNFLDHLIRFVFLPGLTFLAFFFALKINSSNSHRLKKNKTEIFSHHLFCSKTSLAFPTLTHRKHTSGILVSTWNLMGARKSQTGIKNRNMRIIIHTL